MESNEIILNLNLDLETERKVWNDYISNGLIPITRKCPKCNKNISIKENNSKFKSKFKKKCNPNI